MAFDIRKFKRQKQIARIREIRGEDAELIIKTLPPLKKEKKIVKPTHSFSHLLNVPFKVEQIDWKFKETPKTVNTYPITEKDKLNRLLREGAKEKTFLDD